MNKINLVKQAEIKKPNFFSQIVGMLTLLSLLNCRLYLFVTVIPVLMYISFIFKSQLHI